jgi:hypothetical protein
MTRRYHEPAPGEWVQPVRTGYKLACCHCGLVHRIDFRLVPSANGGRTIQLRFRHDRRATAAVRRGMRRETEGE